MKSVRVEEFGEPEVMRLVELPEPQAGPDEVIVRIGAAGVNPVDTYIRAGQYAAKPALPYTPGKDGAGTVECSGAGFRRRRTRFLVRTTRRDVCGTGQV